MAATASTTLPISSSTGAPAPDTSAACTTSGSSGGFELKIRKWHAVAAWTWDAGDDVCGICRTPFDGCPPEAKFPGDDSPVVWGTCSHAFHLQCIQKWLGTSTEQKCPMCRRAWEYKSASEGS